MWLLECFLLTTPTRSRPLIAIDKLMDVGLYPVLRLKIDMLAINRLIAEMCLLALYATVFLQCFWHGLV